MSKPLVSVPVKEKARSVNLYVVTIFYVMVDVCNHSINYTISGYTNMMSPDDHFQDLKRAIAAVGGKARRVNVIIPYLYESRQSKRIGRESLDCASALQELTKMGVETSLHSMLMIHVYRTQLHCMVSKLSSRPISSSRLSSKM